MELYEDDGEFVLGVEMPGFEREETDVRWYEGRPNVAAEHEDAGRGRKETYHRSFRVPKGIEEDDITATYRNGVLEVTLDDRGRDHPWPVHRNRGLTVASARRSAFDSPTSPSLVPGHRSVGAL